MTLALALGLGFANRAYRWESGHYSDRNSHGRTPVDNEVKFSLCSLAVTNAFEEFEVFGVVGENMSVSRTSTHSLNSGRRSPRDASAVCSKNPAIRPMSSRREGRGVAVIRLMSILSSASGERGEGELLAAHGRASKLLGYLKVCGMRFRWLEASNNTQHNLIVPKMFSVGRAAPSTLSVSPAGNMRLLPIGRVGAAYPRFQGG
ncbi:hypothetical protein NPX13_g4258 [Xylaria arbuscula]|uniref:Uncharacterized protein n=1 Tax=Xylaria arbuscula TaxID=114810 RepID=A0A9W8NG78_9PEZI|nr:hypothetical protein NPX13_g4258 [Xylaria arbuscula]